uniref:Uncharacterized protein n=1 Tax=Oryza barthii TaxID=65489 RepID=A0A0D3H9T5_9ORYZ
MKGKETSRKHGSLAMGAEGRESSRVGDDPAHRPAGAGGAARSHRYAPETYPHLAISSSTWEAWASSPIAAAAAHPPNAPLLMNIRGIRLWDETTGEKRVIVLRRLEEEEALGMAATSCNPWAARVRVLTLGPEFVRLVPPVGLFYIGIMGRFQVQQCG